MKRFGLIGLALIACNPTEIEENIPTKQEQNGDGIVMCEPTAKALEKHKLDEFVLLTGKITHEEENHLPVLLEILNSSNKTIFHLYCPEKGNFKANLPAGLGEIRIGAFLDLAADGPTFEDPGVLTAKFNVDSSPIKGLELNLVEKPDLDGWMPWEQEPSSDPSVEQNDGSPEPVLEEINKEPNQ